MIVTKEHQEAMIEIYKKQGRTKDEICGYIDGMSDMLNYISKKMNEGINE